MAYLFSLTLLLAPLYIWRFNIAGLPLNFLMVWVALAVVVALPWLVYRQELKQFLAYSYGRDKILFWLVALWFLAGSLSLFIGGFSVPKAGQFIVLFAEPIAVFFLLRYIAANSSRTHSAMRTAIYLFLACAGLLALIQYTTLLGLPSDWWGNAAEPKRAIGFFVHPNGFALFIAPLLAFLVPDLFRRLEKGAWRRSQGTIMAAAAWGLGAIGLFLSLSRGGWLGFAAAAIVYGIFMAGRKYFLATIAGIVVCGLVVAAVPNLRYRIILPFYGEKSAVARLSLWHTGERMIRDNPVAGKGLIGFGNNWDNYNTDAGLDHYNSPHNIILNFWIDTGLLGLVSFLGLLIYAITQGFRSKGDVWKTGLVLFMVALAVHGLIDTPYFKNDLALVFWIVYALAFI
jgi:O-antigen ligase